ncbi:Bromodomain-domain-containing protein [Saitoella complicata NRRL Y-17804]|nr:Bromodomain-domain-containing protein [Saitoella complicata NRRL Y-17804]ODQ55539.1 Bromodomain-domain-containing protein [Saitoella complicata NRRL Y-17804]
MSKRNAASPDLDEPRKRQRSAPAKGGASDVLKDCRALIQAVIDATDEAGELISAPFLKLVPKKAYPDYYKIITQPIAIDQIQRKVKNGEYTRLSDCKKDFLLMVSNAKTYNSPESQLYEDAITISKVVKGFKGEAPADDDEEDDVELELTDEEDVLPAYGSKTDMEKSVLDAARELIHEITHIKNTKSIPYSVSFMSLPDKREYADYYQKIKEPMSFNMILKKMRSPGYESLGDLDKEVELIFSNAFSYNEEGSPIWKDAKAMQKSWRKKIEKRRIELGEIQPPPPPTPAVEAPKLKLTLGNNSATPAPPSALPPRIKFNIGTGGTPVPAPAETKEEQIDVVSAAAPAAPPAPPKPAPYVPAPDPWLRDPKLPALIPLLNISGPSVALRIPPSPLSRLQMYTITVPAATTTLSVSPILNTTLPPIRAGQFSLSVVCNGRRVNPSPEAGAGGGFPVSLAGVATSRVECEIAIAPSPGQDAGLEGRERVVVLVVRRG